MGAEAINDALKAMQRDDPTIDRIVKILEIKPIRLTHKGTLTLNSAGSISKFLNRLMVMPVAAQEKLLSVIEGNMQVMISKQAIYKSLRGEYERIGSAEN